MSITWSSASATCLCTAIDNNAVVGKIAIYGLLEMVATAAGTMMTYWWLALLAALCPSVRLSRALLARRTRAFLWYRIGNELAIWWVLFCSLAVLDPRVGHTVDVLSRFIPVLCHSDWLFHGESCPRLDVVHPGRAQSSSPACPWHCSLHYLFLQTTPLFPHGVTIVC